MSEVNPALVKQLREKTNAGMMDCKRALVESGGDLSKAEDILRKKGDRQRLQEGIPLRQRRRCCFLHSSSGKSGCSR